MGRYRERMRSLNADYEATRESFDQAVTAYNEERQANQRRWLDLIDRMKKETTAEEWKALSRYQLKKLDPRELTYAPGGGR